MSWKKSWIKTPKKVDTRYKIKDISTKQFTSPVPLSRGWSSDLGEARSVVPRYCVVALSTGFKVRFESSQSLSGTNWIVKENWWTLIFLVLALYGMCGTDGGGGGCSCFLRCFCWEVLGVKTPSISKPLLTSTPPRS